MFTNVKIFFYQHNTTTSY